MSTPAHESVASRRSRRRSPRWRQLIVILVAIPVLTGLGLWLSLWWAERPLKAVERAISQKDFRRALDLSEGYLKRDPYSSRALDLKAQAYVGLRRYRDALTIYDKLGTDSLAGQRAWAEALLREQRWTDALPLLREVDQKRPADPDVLHELAACAVQAGEFDEGVRKARELAEIPGQSDRGDLLIGILQINQGNYRLASAALESLLQKNPEATGLQVPAAEIFQGLGQSYLNDGRPAEAVVQLEKSLSLEETAERFALLGDARELEGNLDLAAEAWRRAADLEPGLRRAREGLARTALENRQPAAAREWLEPLTGSESINSSIAHLMMRCCTLLGDTDEASRFEQLEKQLRKSEDHKRALDDVVKQSPKSFWALAVRAHRFASEGNRQQAAALLKIVDGIRQKMPESSNDPENFIGRLVEAVFEGGTLPSLDLVPVESH